MKLLLSTNMNHNGFTASSESRDTSSRNSGKTSRTGRSSAMSGSKRNKVDPVVKTVAAVASTTNDEKVEPQMRLFTLKKVAKEQRMKVRENRERLIEEERAALQTKRQEELRTQIRAIMDGMMLDVKKDVLQCLQEQISEERQKIKEELTQDINQAESSLVQQVEKRLTNGEPFQVKVARVQEEFEQSFNKVITLEIEKIHSEVLSEIDDKLMSEKRKWIEQFRRETDRRVRTAEEAIRTDFRVGLEDSQKQCGDILASMQERTASVEQNLTAKIVILDAESAAKLQESERITRSLIDTLLDEREKSMKQMFNVEAATLRNEVSKVKLEVGRTHFKCCVIL